MFVVSACAAVGISMHKRLWIFAPGRGMNAK